MELTHNTILITGGTSGIGLAFAKALLAKDNTVIVTARNEATMKQVLAENPGLIGFTTDVSDPKSLVTLRDQVLAAYPNLNILFNSAGIMRHYDLLAADLQATDLLAEIQTNLSGTILTVENFLPHLSKQAESMIVTVSSGLSYFSMPSHPVYSATKAGVHMFTDALRAQLDFRQINAHVVELVPPLVAETNLEAGSNTDAPGNLPLADLVEIGLAGMAANKTRINAGFAQTMYENSRTVEGEQTLVANMAQRTLPNALN